jgi:hypothetical protein
MSLAYQPHSSFSAQQFDAAVDGDPRLALVQCDVVPGQQVVLLAEQRQQVELRAGALLQSPAGLLVEPNATLERRHRIVAVAVSPFD